MTNSTAPDIDGAREFWIRLFDVTKDEADRLYDESWNKTDGWYDAYLRVRKAAGSLGVWSGPAWFVLRLYDGFWYSGLGGALARLMRPTIGTADGITQADYDTLSRPWAVVIGQVHPDDADISPRSALTALIEEFNSDQLGVDVDGSGLAAFLSGRGVIVSAS